MEGFECQAEELAFSAVSSREPQEALEQGSNHRVTVRVLLICS